MVVQYSDTVKVTVTVPGTRNEKGNYSLSTTTTTELKGRWEVATQGWNSGHVQGVDGKVVQYSGIVYLPKGTAHPPLGAKVEVFEGIRLIATGEVKQFSAGQFNCRLWL